MSANSDSDSGGEENGIRDNESIASPQSESLSRPSSPGPQSPSPQSPSPQSPSSLQSPESPCDPDLANGSSPQASHPSSPPTSKPSSPNTSRPSSPAASRESSPAASRESSPAASRESSPPASPASSAGGKSSPRSQPQSPVCVNGQESEDEAQESEAEESGNEENSLQNDKEADVSKDDEEEKRSEAGSQSEAQESDNEENIPEVNIESADENEDEMQSEKDNASENEMEHSDEEQKQDEQSVHAESDAEIKSDNEDISTKNDVSASSPSSPVENEDKEAIEKEADKDEEDNKPDKPVGEAKDQGDSESDAESDAESEVGGLIADIFGESDDDEEFEGFNEEDIGDKSSKDSPTKMKKEKKKRAKIMSDSEDEKDEEKEEKDEEQGIIEDVPAPPEGEDIEAPEDEPQKKKKKVESDDSDDDRDRKMREDFVSDFDLMMQRKKEESSKRRRRRDVDLISDSDDLIADIISQMRQAAEEDKILNKQKKTATKKLKILPMVMSQLKKQDLKTAFLDQGVLNVIAEWLTPLPDRSLPHLNIREGMMKQLSDLPPFDQSLLKSSGIGRALMYLYKHPKETKENREKAGRLITEWARPIFNVTTNYHSLTKEEREQRDYDHVPQKKRKLKDQDAEEEEATTSRKDIETEMDGEKTAIRPGDKGWIGRARVPMPSTKDYVNRPKWNKEMEFGRGPAKKPLSRIEKHMRTMQDKKRSNKQQRAITISIEGRKMAI